PLRGKLSIFRYQAAQELDQVREQGMRDVEKHKDENHQLQRTITSLQTQLDKLNHEHGLVREELRRRDARDEDYVSSKLPELHAEMDSISRKHEEELRQKEEEMSDLQRGLRKAFSDCDAMREAMNTLKETYATSLTKVEHEKLLREMSECKAAYETEKSENETLRLRTGMLHSKLHDVQASLKRKEEDKYPDWDYIQGLCPGGIQEWGMKCKDLDYNDSIIVLLRELFKVGIFLYVLVACTCEAIDTGIDGIILQIKLAKPVKEKPVPTDSDALHPTGEPRFFIGLGSSSTVPKHLRYKGKIPNRRLSRRNLCMLIKDTWEAKAVHDAAPGGKGRRIGLADFLYAYLKKRFGSQDAIAEWGYNIHEACKKHRFQSVECQLFYEILNGNLDEQVYHSQKRIIEHLKTTLYRHDMQLHEGRARGILPKSAVVDAVKEVWPRKTAAELEQLQHALDADQPGPTATYRWLFQNDAECMFLDIVREQEMEMRNRYISELSEVLLSMLQTQKNKTDDSKGLAAFRLTAVDASRALARYDAEKSRKEVDTYVARGFGVAVGDVKSRAVIQADKFLMIEAYVPESKLYTELQEFEKKLDSTISRKKLDLLDGLAKPIKTKRTLRVFLSNLASDQYIEMSDLGGAADAFDLESARIPSWTLRIEGRLLDPPGRKPNVTPPKFSSFVKSVIVELDRDSTLYPEGNLIEWHKQPGAPECDGFEVKRRGDSDVNAKILIYLDYAPEKQKLSPELAKLLDLHTDTSSNVIMALWQYVKLHKLQDADDKRFINCDEPLTRILGSAKLPFSSVPDALQRHLFRADPVVLEYTIKVDKEYNMSQFAYDIEVEVDDPIRDKMRSATQPTPVLTRDIGQLDEKIAALVQAINHCKLKRDFMLSFADDPVNFINQWVASQSRDLEVILGDTRVNLEEIRRSDFYAKDSVYEAVFHHLRQKDTQ
ncbi:SWI SNF, matrix associated, actin dependent regulator of chromatin, sub d, member 3, partial [Borealophlyctis nickersoniae]